MTTAQLSGLVVHWHNEGELENLCAAWPDDPRFELVIVDNGSSRELELPATTRMVRPGVNLGFGGGVNLAAHVASGELLLVLNPDVEPLELALEALLVGFDTYPEAAGLVPALVGLDGRSQAPWQARSLPSARALILQPLLGDRRRGPASLEPGARIEQPAAAALAMRRSTFEVLAGFDPRYQPAWFEDVDLARRAADRRLEWRAWPEARFRHGLGGSVPRLGYGRFLVAYHHNLERYLERFHGLPEVAAARAVVLVGLLLRLASLAARTPARAANRSDAALGLMRALRAAASGWRWGVS